MRTLPEVSESDSDEEEEEEGDHGDEAPEERPEGEGDTSAGAARSGKDVEEGSSGSECNG
jgi:hypothetical protein